MGTPVEGIQGIGKAGVFTQSPDIWRFVASQQNKQANAAKALAEERKVRDALIEDNRKFAPGKVWEPFYAEVEDAAQRDVRDWTTQQLSTGKTPNQFESERMRRQGEVRKLENKINSYRTIYEDISQRIDKDENLDANYYHGKVNDHFFNGRQAKPTGEIKLDTLESILDDPAGYNMQNVVSNFMKDLPLNTIEKYQKIHSDLGEQFDVSQVKTKLGIRNNASGSVDIDTRTGLPKISMTDDVAMAAMEDPYMRNWLVSKIGLDGVADMDRVKKELTPLLTPYDQTTYSKDTKHGFKYDDTDRANQTGFTVPVTTLEERHDTLYKITHDFDPTLLAGLSQGFKDRDIRFKFDDSKYPNGTVRSDTEKPTAIVMKLPNPKYVEDTSDESDRYITKELPLITEDDKQSAMEELSTILDEKAPAKSKQGENFSNFRKKKFGEQTNSKNEKSKTGGVY